MSTNTQKLASEIYQARKAACPENYVWVWRKEWRMALDEAKRKIELNTRTEGRVKREKGKKQLKLDKLDALVSEKNEAPCSFGIARIKEKVNATLPVKMRATALGQNKSRIIKKYKSLGIKMISDLKILYSLHNDRRIQQTVYSLYRCLHA